MGILGLETPTSTRQLPLETPTSTRKLPLETPTSTRQVPLETLTFTRQLPLETHTSTRQLPKEIPNFTKQLHSTFVTPESKGMLMKAVLSASAPTTTQSSVASRSSLAPTLTACTPIITRKNTSS